MATSIADAAALAHEVLHRALPDRYAHVTSVSSRAVEVCCALGHRDYPIVAAAWLHDIGYAPGAVDTGFHPLDGARFLVGYGLDPAVTSLVAHHSSAAIEARMRGCRDELSEEFPVPDAETHELLTFCDMTTGSRGERLTIDERLADIFTRYEPDDVVHRSTKRAEDDLRSIVSRVESRLMLSPSRAQTLH